ncbi:hypothetical protein JOM56_002938 [Amanita muscaria]
MKYIKINTLDKPLPAFVLVNGHLTAISAMVGLLVSKQPDEWPPYRHSRHGLLASKQPDGLDGDLRGRRNREEEEES